MYCRIPNLPPDSGGTGLRKDGKVNKEDWQPNALVKVRFEKNGGAIASRAFSRLDVSGQAAARGLG